MNQRAHISTQETTVAEDKQMIKEFKALEKRFNGLVKVADKLVGGAKPIDIDGVVKAYKVASGLIEKLMNEVDKSRFGEFVD